MKIVISPEVFIRFPRLRLGCLLIKNLDNHSKLQESLHLLQDVEKLVRLAFNKDTVKTHYLISPWSVARREFGKEAQHYHTSLERLLHQVLEGKSAARKDTLTNILHYLMLKHLIPMGLDDLAKVQGTITFALGSGKGKARKGELYYHDGKKTLGAKLDYWKNPQSAVSPSTTSALLHVEGLPPLTRNKVREVLSEAEQLISTFGGGKTSSVILWRKKRVVQW